MCAGWHEAGFLPLYCVCTSVYRHVGETGGACSSRLVCCQRTVDHQMLQQTYMYSRASGGSVGTKHSRWFTHYLLYLNTASTVRCVSGGIHIQQFYSPVSSVAHCVHMCGADQVLADPESIVSHCLMFNPPPLIQSVLQTHYTAGLLYSRTLDNDLT